MVPLAVVVRFLFVSVVVVFDVSELCAVVLAPVVGVVSGGATSIATSVAATSIVAAKVLIGFTWASEAADA